MKLTKIIPLIASVLALGSCSMIKTTDATSSSSSSSSTTTHGGSTSHGPSTGTSTGTNTGTYVDPEDGSWTILVYMCGSNLESGYDSSSGTYDTKAGSYGYATSDLNEIASVIGQPDDVNIVVEAGGSKKWYSSIANASKLNRFHLENKKYVLDEQITNASMGLLSTFESFLEWGLSTYPADHTGVILWNHGGGMFGVCYDENYSDDSLYDNEVKSAVSSAFTKLDRAEKLEFIGYDACLMGVQDVAEFNSDYFNYMVCAQESESGSGWDYDTWIDDVYNHQPVTNILTAIVDGFIDDNGGVNASQTTYNSADQTLSYLDLSKMADYKTAFENLATALKSKVTTSNKSSFNTNVMGKTKYFAGSDYDYFCEFDIEHFLTILKANSTFNPGGTYISDVESALSELVAYSLSQKEGAADAHGLSLFYAFDNSYGQQGFHSSTYSNFTNWNSFVKTYATSFTSSYVA